MKKGAFVLFFFFALLVVNGHAYLVRIGPFPGMSETEQYAQPTDENRQSENNDDQTKGGSCTFSQQIVPNPNLITTPFLSTTPPFRITVSGQYCLVNDTTVPAGTNGISIETNNVFLDLQNKCIKGQSNSGTGIVILGNNRTNITIRDGSIFTMGNNGIQINSGGEQIIFDNLKLCRNNSAAINVSGLRDFVIKNCLVTFNNNQGISIGPFGVMLSQNGIISNCIVAFNNLNGLQLTGGSNLQFFNINASNNGNSGINEAGGNRLTFQNCQANNNSIHGFFLTGLAHSFAECIANSNGAVGFWATGNRLNFEECQAKGNTLDGFRLSGNNNNISNCLSVENMQIGFNVSGNQHSYQQCSALANGTSGFSVFTANHCILKCLAKLNTTFGFLLNASSTQCQIRSNTAVANGTVGFQNNTTTVNRIYSNFGSDNGMPPAAASNFVGIPNVFTSPVPADAINFTTNISN